MLKKFEGVYWHEEDREFGPFKLRIGGTRDFVSLIDPEDYRSSPPGRVELVEGWDNPRAILFDTIDQAKEAAAQVWSIEGFHTSVEATRHR